MVGNLEYPPHQFSCEMKISSHRVFPVPGNSRVFSYIFVVLFRVSPSCWRFFRLLFWKAVGATTGVLPAFLRDWEVCEGCCQNWFRWWKYHDAKLGPQGWKSFFLADLNFISGDVWVVRWDSMFFTQAFGGLMMKDPLWAYRVSIF